MEKYKEKIKLTEMAMAGKVKELNVIVWTDHNPPHFHIIKRDLFDVLINIETLEIMKYKFQKNNNSKLSSIELKNVSAWLYKKINNISNINRIKILWNGLNPDKKIKEN